MAGKELEKDMFGDVAGIMTQVMMMTIALMFILPFIISRLPVTQAAQQFFESQQYEGQSIVKVLDATPILQCADFIMNEPYTGLISASLHNDGWVVGDTFYAWSVFIGMNSQDELHELKSGEDYYIDMAGADRRIEQIFYKSNPGQRALVRLVGKY